MTDEASRPSISPSDPPAVRVVRAWRDTAENLAIIGVASYAWLGTDKIAHWWEWFTIVGVVAGVAGVGPIVARIVGTGGGPRSLSGLLLAAAGMLNSKSG